MKAQKSIKIPAYAFDNVASPGCFSLKTVATFLRIEAKLYRRNGNKEAARALEVAAQHFRLIGPTMSPGMAFDWGDYQQSPPP